MKRVAVTFVEVSCVFGFCCWLTPITPTVLCVSTCSDGLLDFHTASHHKLELKDFAPGSTSMAALSGAAKKEGSDVCSKHGLPTCGGVCISDHRACGIWQGDSFAAKPETTQQPTEEVFMWCTQKGEAKACLDPSLTFRSFHVALFRPLLTIRCTSCQ